MERYVVFLLQQKTKAEVGHCVPVSVSLMGERNFKKSPGDFWI